MKSTFRSIVSALMIGLLLGGPGGSAYSAIGDIDAKQGSGVYNNVDMLRLTQAGIVYISTSATSAGITLDPITGITVEGSKDLTVNDDIFLPGLNSNIRFGPGTVHSATATATASNGVFFTGFLQAGTGPNIAASEGSVLCATTTTVGQGVTLVVCPATLNLSFGVAGFAAVAAATGAVVNIYSSGWVNALTTGTVNPGDLLITSSLSAGYLQTATTVASTNTVAIALAVGTSAGGLTKVKLFR